MNLRSASLPLALAFTVALAPAAALAQATGSQTGSQSTMPGSAAGQSTATHTPGDANAADMSQPNPAGTPTWTDDQILTATVHQAWMLAGRDETKFFEIVRQLAEISAKNRNLTLPDDPAAGKRAGEYIREHAKADHDQLLYAIVDQAVQMTATKSASSTAASSH